jgi:tetratricopeptide (TPR) repeat protein
MRQHKRIAVLVLAGVLGVLLLSTSHIVVRGLRSRRLASGLLKQANRAEEQGRLDQAAHALAQYQCVAPQDGAARARYVHLVEQLVAAPTGTPLAARVLEEFLNGEPERHDVRRRLAVLQMGLGAGDDAQRNLEVLVKAFPKDGELAYQLGLCQERQSADEQAVNSYQAAILHAPTRVESYQRLAYLLRRRLQQPAEADQVLDQMVEANPQSFQVYLARAAFRRQFDGSLLKAERDVAAALRLAPDEVEVLLTAGELAREQGKLSDARKHLEHGLERHPREVRLYQALAGLELRAGRRAQAVACLRRGLREWPNHSQLLWTLADLALQGGETKEVPGLLEQLRQANLPNAWLEYLDARLKISEEKWLEASRILERVRPQLVESPELSLQADLLLGQCFQQLGDPDKQLEAFQRAAAGAPLNVAARRGRADALTRLGKQDAAVTELEKAMQLPQAPTDGWILLAELLVRRNLQAPVAKQQWGKVEAVLAQAAAAMPEALEVPLLRAEVLAVQGQFAKARQLIEEARAKQPKQLQPWIALARLTARREAKREALFAVLDVAERHLGDSVDLRLARLRYLPERPTPETTKTLAKAAAGLEGFAPKERGLLLQALGEASYRLGQLADAGRWWQQAADLRPYDLNLRSHLFDLALETDDEAVLPRRLQEIERIEGTGGPLGRYADACRLLRLARQGSRQLVPQARAQLVEVARQRPAWARVALRLAEMDELEGKPEAAVENYWRAVELGEGRGRVVRRLLHLLIERQRYTQAEEVLLKFEEQGPLAKDLQRLGAETALRGKDLPRARDRAKRAVAADAKDFRDYVWLGQILADTGPPAEAEEAFGHAVRLAENLADPWVVRVRYYVSLGRKEKAVSVLQEAQGKLAKEQRSLALALGYEALGRLDQVEEQLRAALAAKPDAPTVLLAVGRLYVQLGQPRQALPHLRKALDAKTRASAELIAAARRELARALTNSGGYAAFREALALLDQDIRENGANREGQRLRAAALATRSGRRREAIGLFEEIQKRYTLAADQQFLLAQPYEAEGDWAKANEGMQAVLSNHADETRYLVPYIHSLLRRNALGRAQVWLARLQQLRPNDDETLLLSARLLAGQQQEEDTVGLLTKYVEDKRADPRQAAGRLLSAARLLDQLSQEDVLLGHGYQRAAEALYRRFAALTGQPENELVLAEYVARQGRYAEALDLCERALDTCAPLKVAVVGAIVLQEGLTKEPPFLLLEQWLARALQKKPQAAPLLVVLGRVREHQRRFADAEALYRQAITAEPNYVVALNDLAYLLALQGIQTEEALTLIQRASDQAGATAAFLDTRAVASLALGRTEAAITDLDEALADTPTAVRYLHLARAHLAANNRTAAAEAFRKAQTLPLRLRQLHPLDREAFTRLRAELGQR